MAVACRIQEQSADEEWAIEAAAVVRRVVLARFRDLSSDVDDVCAQAMLQLADWAQRSGRQAPQTSVDDFANYVAAVAHHACDHHVRSRHPLRWRLRNRIRYALEHDARFVLWKSADGVWWSGLAGFQDVPRGVQPPFTQLTPGDGRRPQHFLLQLFQRSRGPLELTTVVDLAASLWGIPMSTREQLENADTVPDPQATADMVVEHRQTAARLWVHIQELPARQRQALLLNLKDDAARMLIATGTASLAAIADAVEMTRDTLAGVWNRLPLNDHDIALRLGCTRQQVINLRMAARKRLANRLFRSS